jgi:hypothetical protein
LKFIQKQIRIRNNDFFVYQPFETPKKLWFVNPVTRTRSILGSSEGFSFLRELFMIVGTNNKRNSLFFIPHQTKVHDDLNRWWPNANFHLNLVCFNYHNAQLPTKVIKTILERSELITGITLELDYPKEAIKDYEKKYHEMGIKLSRKLTCKSISKILTIAGDQDIFIHLSRLVHDYGSIEDNEDYNGFHRHADWLGSSKENGIDFFYYCLADS